VSLSRFSFLRRVRIHDGECGAVARALHHEIEDLPLSAVDKKVLFTTKERKVMSKTTFFKRVALTAIAALGLGMLSVAPSQAVAGVPTIVVGAGSASVTSGNGQETATAATIDVSGLITDSRDSYTVVVTQKSGPTTGGTFVFALMDTTTSVGSTVSLTAGGSGAVEADMAYKSSPVTYDSVAVGTAMFLRGTANTYIGARFGVLLDSHTARVADNVGTYVFTVIVTPYTNGGGSTSVTGSVGTPVTADVSFTINATAANAALASGTIDPSKTTAILNSSTGTTATSDAEVSALATAAETTRATIRVRTYTSASLQAPESVTITITGPGLVGTSAGVYGKSITTAADGDDNFLIRSDGTAGTASIVVATTTVTFPAKTMTFYAAKASKVVAEVRQPVIGVGAQTDVIRATITDANGVVWGGTAYIYAASATDATIASSATPAACTFNAASGKHRCPVTGKLKGSASLKVIDAATVATANATSDAVSVRVSTGVATTAKISFDKATYAPGEKAQLRVQILDQEGLAEPAATVNAAFASALTSNVAFGAGSASLSGSANITLSGYTDATEDANAGHQTFVVYMPMQAGEVVVTGTGGTGLAAAGRVVVTGSAKVVAPIDPQVAAAAASAEAATDAALEAIDAANAATDAANLAAEAADAATVAAEEARDAADAATAAVEALATEVSTLIAGLRAQITTLANTVAKIAKKVKA